MYNFVVSSNENVIFKNLSSTDQMLLLQFNTNIDKNADQDKTVSDLSSDVKLGEESAKLSALQIYGFINNVNNRISESGDDKIAKRKLKRLKRKVKTLLVIDKFIEYVIDRISIHANLNLLEFSASQKDFSFNKSIEGGLGFSYEINPNLHLGINWENFYSRQLRDNIKALDGQRIEVNGETVGDINSISLENNNFYIDRNLSGIGLKVIATF